MAAYYNEIDPFAAAWLRELIRAGHIADGEVDERSVADVRPDDIRGFVQCHFFAGIGGWTYALRLAGWTDDRPVWTGSCPCQPFSRTAGAQTGGADPRDLWPVWFQLVRECRPDIVFGEQVEAAIGHGWLDRLCDDLESEGYAVGACSLPAASVGAFHIRQRLWFVGESTHADQRRHGGNPREPTSAGRTEAWSSNGNSPRSASGMGWVADTEHAERRSIRRSVEDERHGNDAGRAEAHGESGACGQVRNVAHAEAIRLGQGCTDDARGSEGTGSEGAWSGPADAGGCGGLGDSHDTRSQGRGLSAERAGECVAGTPGLASGLADACCSRRQQNAGSPSSDEGPDGRGPERDHVVAGDGETFWSDVLWLPCADGKARPVEPGTFPLAHGVPARVGRLRGYGNAIVPQVAAEFIQAYEDTLRGEREAWEG